MSKLIPCPACGRQVSPNAAACPSCAEPIRPERTNQGAINLRDPIHVAGIIACLVFIALVLVFVYDHLVLSSL